MATNNYPATRMRLKKLLAPKDFQKLQERARADKKNIRQYVKETRQKFNLSPYWGNFLEFALLYGFSPDNLAGAAEIVTLNDLDVGKEYYYIAVYPETSKRDYASFLTQDLNVRKLIIDKLGSRASINKVDIDNLLDLPTKDKYDNKQGAGILEFLQYIQSNYPDKASKKVSDRVKLHIDS
jgi:hypothetical protein